MENKFIKNYNKDITPFVNIKDNGKNGTPLYYLRYGDAIRLVREEYGDNAEILTLTSTVRVKDNYVEVPYFKCTDANYAYVRTRVILHGTPIGDVVQEETLPISDDNYKSIPLDKITTSDVDDTIQRCKVKNIATATGIGFCLYRGKMRDHIEEREITKEDEISYTDNFYKFLYKQNPLNVNINNETNTRKILGNKYLSWADFLLALKTLFPYSTYGNAFSNYFVNGENEERHNYKERENGEIAVASYVNIVIPLFNQEGKIAGWTTKHIDGERRVLDPTRLRTVNLNVQQYTYTRRKTGETKQIVIDFGQCINSANKRCFCKTLAENSGLYLNFYQKEQKEMEDEQKMEAKKNKEEQVSTQQNQMPGRRRETDTITPENNAQSKEREKSIKELNAICYVLIEKGYKPSNLSGLATLYKKEEEKLTNEDISDYLDKVAKNIVKENININIDTKTFSHLEQDIKDGYFDFRERLERFTVLQNEEIR